MDRNRYALALFVLMMFGLGFVIGHPRSSSSIPQKTPRHSNESDGLPSVNARITKATASPDFSLIALVLQEQNGQSIAVFDPAGKRIIAREASNNQSPRFSWSPDGKHLAASVDKGLALIDKIGRVQFLAKQGSRPVWRSSNPNKLVYRATDLQTQNLVLRERDLPTGNDREVLRVPDDECVGVFGVKGHLCAALLYRVKPGSYEWKRIDVVDIASRDRIASIPGHGWDLDWASFDMSSDGQTFAINAGASGGAVFIIGRTSEAQTTLLHLNRAVLYEANAGGAEEVVWALSGSPAGDASEASKDPDYALVNSEAFPPVLLDLVNGSSHSQVGHPKDVSYISWWKCGATSSSIWKQQFLVVRSDGLWITSNPKTVGDTADDRQLILRHKYGF